MTNPEHHQTLFIHQICGQFVVVIHREVFVMFNGIRLGEPACRVP